MFGNIPERLILSSLHISVSVSMSTLSRDLKLNPDFCTGASWQCLLLKELI